MSKVHPRIFDSDSGIKRRWIKGLLFLREGKKFRLNRKALLWLSFAGMLAMMVAVFSTKLGEGYEVKADFNTNDLVPVKVSAFNVANEGPSPGKFDGETSGARGSRKPESPSRITKKLQLIERNQNLTIPPGSFIQAKLVTGASNGAVKAVTLEALKANGDVLIPVGTMLFGEGQSSEERLFVNFTQAIVKDSKPLSIDAQGCSSDDKVVGLKGSKVGGKATRLAASAALNFLSGMSDALQETDVRGGATVRKVNPKNALLSGTSKAAYEEARGTASSFRDRAVVIVVPAETVICVIFKGQARNE